MKCSEMICGCNGEFFITEEHGVIFEDELVYRCNKCSKLHRKNGDPILSENEKPVYLRGGMFWEKIEDRLFNLL